MLRPSVVIPLYQRADLTVGCLEALERTGALDRAEVILVDNASTDETPALCAAWAGRVTTLRNEANLGFAVACNQGARAASGDVLVFLNNDTVVHDGWLDPLLAAVADPRVGVAGSRLLYPGGRVQHAGMALMAGCVPVHIHRYLPGDHPVVTRTRDLAIVTGACMALRRDVFLGSGAFDEGYRNGFEDTDLCLRLAAQGLVARYCGDSVVTHLESMSPGRLDHDHLNGARFRRRWRDWRPDLRTLLAEDGLDGLESPNVVWRGPLMDDSPAAREGREAIVALTRAGLRPAALETPVGDAGPGVGAGLPAEVLAAVNRVYLSRGVARVFHHLTPGARHPAPVPGARLVVVHSVTADPSGVSADAVVPAAPASGIAAAADAALGPLGDAPEGVGYWGPALGESRSAVAGRGLAWALTDAGRPVRLVATDADGAANRGTSLPDMGPQDFLPGVWVAVGSPVDTPERSGWVHAATSAGGRVAAWCWADGDGVPAPWWEALRWADELWVPSEFTSRSFTAAGLDAVPVRVIPPAIDTDLFAPAPAGRGDRPVTLLAVLDWTWLGGWDLLVNAYVDEFTADEPVRLRLVVRTPTRAVPAVDAVALLDRLGRDPESIADLDLIPVPPSDPALAEALRGADAFIHPVRGEGLGRELLAAMACGVPVIATAFGAHDDLLTSGHAAAVPVVRRVPVGPDEAAGRAEAVGLTAAEPSLDVLRSAMRGVVADPHAWRERARPLVDHVRSTASIPAVTGLVRARLDRLAARDRVAR